MADKWRTWGEIEADAKALDRIDEAAVSAHQDRMRAAQRANRLAEIRMRLAKMGEAFSRHRSA